MANHSLHHHAADHPSEHCENCGETACLNDVNNESMAMCEETHLFEEQGVCRRAGQDMEARPVWTNREDPAMTDQTAGGTTYIITRASTIEEVDQTFGAGHRIEHEDGDGSLETLSCPQCGIWVGDNISEGFIEHVSREHDINRCPGRVTVTLSASPEHFGDTGDLEECWDAFTKAYAASVQDMLEAAFPELALEVIVGRSLIADPATVKTTSGSWSDEQDILDMLEEQFAANLDRALKAMGTA